MKSSSPHMAYFYRRNLLSVELDGGEHPRPGAWHQSVSRPMTALGFGTSNVAAGSECRAKVRGGRA